jgi:hypothetical protein
VTAVSGPQQTRIAAVFERFPGPVTFRPSKLKYLALLVVSAIFTASAFLPNMDAATGWFVGLFFGLCTLIALIALMPGAMRLTLERERFIVKTLFRMQACPWKETDAFAAVKVPSKPWPRMMLGYNWTKHADTRLGRMNVALCGRNCALPDNYGWGIEDLAALMAAWRTKALT